MEISNTVNVPVFSGRALPDKDDELFSLFVVTVFTPIVSQVLKGTVTTLSAEEIDDAATHVLASNKFAKSVVENISGWKDSAKDA